jgi:hypothetical protein
MQTAGFFPTRLAQLTASMQLYVDRGEVSGVVRLPDRAPCFVRRYSGNA